MSARDELARDWTAAFNSDIPVVDYLHAAGYTKPRTISTAEELDALPDDSVVLDADGWVLRKNRLTWRAVASSGLYSRNAIGIPATVLYEPAP